jgi:transcriptional regulator with XRE-family HTH domain
VAQSQNGFRGGGKFFDLTVKHNRTEVKNLTGLKIRLFREKRGWTQHQFAESLQKTGVSVTRDVIANIETQRCPVTDCQIVLFARVLGISWQSLFPDKNILEKFMPPITPKRATKQNSHADKIKHPTRSSVTGPSRKGWNLCEVTCKSVKITFRETS